MFQQFQERFRITFDHLIFGKIGHRTLWAFWKRWGPNNSNESLEYGIQIFQKHEMVCSNMAFTSFKSMARVVCISATLKLWEIEKLTCNFATLKLWNFGSLELRVFDSHPGTHAKIPTPTLAPALLLWDTSGSSDMSSRSGNVDVALAIFAFPSCPKPQCSFSCALLTSPMNRCLRNSWVTLQVFYNGWSSVWGHSGPQVSMVSPELEWWTVMVNMFLIKQRTARISRCSDFFLYVIQLTNNDSKNDAIN